jgi:hypothetical protein
MTPYCYLISGQQILTSPHHRQAGVPILIQVYFNSALAYWLNRKLGVAHSVACPSALIGASNFSNWLWQRQSVCSDFPPELRWRRWWSADRGSRHALGRKPVAQQRLVRGESPHPPPLDERNTNILRREV